MSVVTREQFDGRFSAAQLDSLVNSLLVPMHEFAFTSNLFHRFFGVLTGAADGERTYTSDPQAAIGSNTKDRMLMNACLRFQYPKIAARVQESIEGELHWLTTERYVYEDIPLYTWRTSKFATKYPGVAVMNVVPVWHTLEDYDKMDVNFFLEDADILLNPYGDGTPAALISSTLSPNPNDIYLRDKTTYVSYPWFSDGEHRIARDLDNEIWQLALNTSIQSYNNETLGVQSRRVVQVKIPAPTIPSGAILYPVYPGTNQIIPQAQAMFIDDDDQWVYTFWIYTLVHPTFEAETVDLMSAGEFWKLYPYISFKYLTEEVAHPQVRVTRGSETVVYTGPTATETTEVGPLATLVNHEQGIFHLNYDTCQRTYAWNCLCNNDSWPRDAMLRVFYKVHPDYLPLDMRNYRTNIFEAVCARIATELPFANCGCAYDVGYIAQMHVLANSERTYTAGNNVIDKVRYGNLYGQVVAAEIMNEATKHERPVLL